MSCDLLTLSHYISYHVPRAQAQVFDILGQYVHALRIFVRMTVITTDTGVLTTISTLAKKTIMYVVDGVHNVGSA